MDVVIAPLHLGSSHAALLLPRDAAADAVLRLWQGCDKVLKKIIEGLEPSKVSSGPCGKRIAKSQHAYKCLDCGAGAAVPAKLASLQ